MTALATLLDHLYEGDVVGGFSWWTQPTWRESAKPPREVSPVGALKRRLLAATPKSGYSSCGR